MYGRRTKFAIASLVLGGALVFTSACSHTPGSPALPSAVSAMAMHPDAGGFKVLYAFSLVPDGMTPAAGLVAVGNTLYGTTESGGMGNGGSVFSTSLSGSERVLYSFSLMQDGSFPSAALTYVGGAFYGTTAAGGSGYGTIFKMDKSGNEHVLYAFKGGTDGAAPYTSLVADGGVLYGTTTTGGGTPCAQGCGTVFSITTSGKEHVIYRFQGVNNDGIGPFGSLLVLHGQLYGTTANGGKNGEGTIFKTSKSGSERVVYSFGDVANDGSEPEAGLVDVGGKLYGTTNNGGSHFKGAVFETSASGAERVIYSFKGGGDGANPEANLIYSKGKLYGTTSGGGAPNQGTVFSVTPAGHEHVIHALKGTDGSDPRAPLMLVNGALYGTASLGGKNGVGTIFRVIP